jgi:dTDP-4-dehydrorhamnose reductase
LRVLIVGKSGQLSAALAEAFCPAVFDVVRVGRPEIDLAAPRPVFAIIKEMRPDIVINAAAYTAVDQAEDEPEAAQAVNVAGAEAVARAAAETGAAIIHFSTDYVFDGMAARPYAEDDVTSPGNVYGTTKRDGEIAVANANPRHVIFRTAWLFSPFGSNFVKTILRLRTLQNEIGVVDDQRGCPTSATDLACAVRDVAVKLVGSPESSSPNIFHAVNGGSTTWYGFAEKINEFASARDNRIVAVRPIGSKDYPTRARRPALSVLCAEKLSAHYGLRLRPWESALRDCIDRLMLLTSYRQEAAQIEGTAN